MTYNKETIEYLPSEHRKIANYLIDYEVEHNLSQKEMATLLHIDFEKLIDVEFNLPDTPECSYTEVKRKLVK